MTLFLPLCPIFTSILLFSIFELFSMFFYFSYFCCFISDVVDDFVTNRWQNGERVN